MTEPTETAFDKFELLPFQAEDVQKLKDQKSCLVGSDPGTGKTYVGIALDLERRAKHGGIPRKTLVICPKSVIPVWDMHCMDLTDEDVFVVDPKNRHIFAKDVLNPNTSGYFICHWDALRLIPELKKEKWFHVIADEVHRAKGRKTQMTRALKGIPAAYKTGMSGTPADDKPQDLWSIINWLWPRYYTSYWNFVKAYMVKELVKDKDDPNDKGYFKFVGVKNLGRLHNEMRPWFVRRLKKDVLPDLPEKYYSRYLVDLTPKQRRAYDSMKKTMVAWAEQHKDELDREDPIIAQAAVVQLIRLQQYACGYVIPRLDDEGNHVYKWKFKKSVTKEERAAIKADPDNPLHEPYKKYIYDVIDPSAKLDALMELLEDRGDEQIVVFSRFKSVISLLEQRLIDRGITHGILTGDTPNGDRGPLVQDFQSGKLRVFAGTIAAGGVGITLTAASTVVFIDRLWNPSLNMQAEDRLHRIGQKNAVEIIDLIAKNTVDVGQGKKVAMKWRNIQLLLGDITEADVKQLEEGSNYDDEGREDDSAA